VLNPGPEAKSFVGFNGLAVTSGEGTSWAAIPTGCKRRKWPTCRDCGELMTFYGQLTRLAIRSASLTSYDLCLRVLRLLTTASILQCG